MTDRELLKLAAKAYGLELGKPAGDGYYNAYEPDDHHMRWNPLLDDGQALRLAAELGILELSAAESTLLVNQSKDPCATVRRSIVRTAAEIGRSK